MLLLLNFFKKKKEEPNVNQVNAISKQDSPRSNEQIAIRKGEIGEYKIDIQLDQLPKDCRYLSDLLVVNPKSKSGYSQIDHVVLTPFGIFVIETKNYQGIIYGGKDRKTWLVNGKFKMMNPFMQNYGHIKALKAFIDEKYHDLFISIVSFTKRCTFKVDLDYRKIASSKLIVYDIELSEFIHRKLSILKIQHKEPLLNTQDISELHNLFSKENIIDPQKREEHTKGINTHIEKASIPSTCSICDQPVSDKVRSYCRNNKKFNGKIYCFEHQKEFR